MAKWSYDAKREASIERGVLMIIAMDDAESEPVAIVRAVNHLHGLGHADAIEALRRFASSHPLGPLKGQDKIFSLEILIPLLFVPKDSGAKLPSSDWDIDNLRATVNRYSLDREAWNLPIELVEGIPFDTEWRMASSTGVRLKKPYLIDWADRDGKLRDSQLVPSDDPFNAALDAAKIQVDLEILSKDSIGEDYADELRQDIEDHMCKQVFAMVSPLVPDFVAPKWNNWSGDKRKWKELSTTCRSQRLHWDRRTQQYALDHDAE